MVKIVFEEDRSRVAAYDGSKHIGEADFRETNGIWSIVHTGVREGYGGQGIAKKLIEEVVKNAREKGVKIEPICSFAVKEFEEKPEYADIKA